MSSSDYISVDIQRLRGHLVLLEEELARVHRIKGLLQEMLLLDQLAGNGQSTAYLRQMELMEQQEACICRRQESVLRMVKEFSEVYSETGAMMEDILQALQHIE